MSLFVMWLVLPILIGIMVWEMLKFLVRQAWQRLRDFLDQDFEQP